MVNELFSTQRTNEKLYYTKIIFFLFAALTSQNAFAWLPYQPINDYSECQRYSSKKMIFSATPQFKTQQSGIYGSQTVKALDNIYTLTNIKCLRGCNGRPIHITHIAAVNLKQTVYRPDIEIPKETIDGKRVAFFFWKWEKAFSTDKLYHLDQNAESHFRDNEVHVQQVSKMGESQITQCSK